MKPLSSIAEAGRSLRSGQATPVDLLEECLGRIDDTEADVRAWVVIDREGARRAAETATDELRRGVDRGPLHGIPVGVKDIIDVAGLPTLAGARVRPNVPATADAFVVAKLRHAGAVVLGKTVTTEFASFDPPPTRNPCNHERTPGGSSSGSAAAVVVGHCYAALGSQTGGSVIRPASYCGAAGMKPTWGRLSLSGIVPLAMHLDHPGPMARSAADLAATYAALAEFDPNDPCSIARPKEDRVDRGPRTSPPRLGIVGEYFADHATPTVRDAAAAAIDRLRAAGADVVEVRLPPSFAGVHASHRRIMAVEAAAYHRETFAARRAEYGPRITELLDEGLAATTADYCRALEHQFRFRRDMERLIESSGVDALAMPAVANTAPPRATTGDPSFQSPWSFSGLPVVSLPVGCGTDGLPVALQFVAAPWTEFALLATAEWCDECLR